MTPAASPLSLGEGVGVRVGRALSLAALSLTLANVATAQPAMPARPEQPPRDDNATGHLIRDIAMKALAPTGTLRAAINFGNPVLAQRGPNGEPQGVSVALATALAHRIGVPLAIVPFAQAGQVTDALPQDTYDICFLARDPVRGQGLAFTDPYVLIEGAYAVADAAPYTTVDSVDADGTAIAVTKGSAYDLFLTRSLQHATLVRYPGNAESGTAFLSGAQPVLASVKQPLAALVAANPGHRLIPGRFMSIEQAMAVPKGRDPAALAALQTFVADAKTSGLVRDALTRSGQPDAEVAP